MLFPPMESPPLSNLADQNKCINKNKSPVAATGSRGFVCLNNNMLWVCPTTYHAEHGMKFFLGLCDVNDN